MYEFQLKKFKKELEPQEVFLDSLAQKREEKLGLSEQKIELPFSKNIPLAVYIVFLAIIAVFFCRVLQLQFVRGEELSYKSLENRLRVYEIKSSRGIIYDSEFEQLVWNKPSADLILDKRDFPRAKEREEMVLKEISKILPGFDIEETKKQIEESEVPVVSIYEELSHLDLVSLESKLKNEKGFPGIEIRESTKREYIQGPNFSHVIGYTGKTDYIGKTGLEKFYEEILRGEPGELYVERDAYGKTIEESISTQPKPGKSLVLWLNSGFQKKIEEELKKKMKELGVEKAAAVALNPKTGGVLALVSLPDFNNNKFSQGISQEELNEIQKNPLKPLFNQAISGIGYPTGSIIKPLIGLAALEEKVIVPSTKIFCPLEICLQNPWDPEKKDCYADWKYHGTSDLRRAIAESVNTFFYQLGGGYEDFEGLGVKKIKKWLENFGWGYKTGIDLPEEGNGILPELDKNWRLGDTYHLSIGQGPFSVTPLQVAVAYAGLINDGKIYQPRVVKGVVDNKDGAIEAGEPEIIKEITLSPENLKVVREGMRQAVTSADGSAYILNSLPVTAAAKTGTAQTGTKDVYHNWITVFASYDDPQIVLTIVIEDVKGLQPAALPVAKEVLKWYFTEKSQIPMTNDQ